MKPPHTVLIAHAVPAVAQSISQHLTSGGLTVIQTSSGSEALKRARQILPNLAILGMTLPDLSGKEVLQTLKADPTTAGMAIVMLSLGHEEVDSIVSFELGADDYVTEPFSLRELALRVKSILARKTASSANRYNSVGVITFDREGREVRVSGQRIDLTVREYRLLNTLFDNPGRVFTREELLNHVWGDHSTVELRTVDTHLRRLRERLGDGAQQIKTVRGFGYRLDAA